MAAIVIFTCGNAVFASILTIDINSIRVEAIESSPQNGYGNDFTGTLDLSSDNDSFIGAVQIDAEFQNFIGTLIDLDGEIELINGLVVNGNLTLDVSGPAGNTMLTLDFADGVIMCVGPFTPLSGNTDNGSFDNNNLGGVDITPWYYDNPYIDGNFFLVAAPYTIDDMASLELILESHVNDVPEPATLTITLMSSLALIRHRRQRG